MKAVVCLFWGVVALAVIPSDNPNGEVFNYHIALGRADRFKQFIEGSALHE